MGKLERDGQSISILCHRARQLLARISDTNAPPRTEALKLVKEMQQLDKEAAEWRQTPEWAYSIVPKPTHMDIPHDIYTLLPDGLQLHRDVWMAYEWNYHRAARMILHGQLLHCLGEVVAGIEAESEVQVEISLDLRTNMETSIAIVQMLAEEVLATVPQCFGDIDATGRPIEKGKLPGCRAIGAYLLLWPIKIIKGVEAATSKQQKEVGGLVFERIRDCTGMKKNLGNLSII